MMNSAGNYQEFRRTDARPHQFTSPNPNPQFVDEDERTKKRKTQRDHHDDDDDEKRGRRRKKKSEEPHKHSKSRERKNKKSRDKHGDKRKYLGSIVELSKDDYFLKNNEFSNWLKEEKGIYFSDLSSEAARDLFSSFVKKWNRRKLKTQYYEGIASAPRTKHNWKIKE